MCANPNTAVAMAACCKTTSAKQRGMALSEYTDELVTRATAKARCEEWGPTWDPCAKEAEPGKSSRCHCSAGGQVRLGYDHFYASNWSEPVTLEDRTSIECNWANFQSDPGLLGGEFSHAGCVP